MKRFVNIRFPVSACLALVAGIALGYLLIRSNISLFYTIAIVPTAAIIFVVLFIYARKKLFIFAILTISFLTVGIFASYLKLDGFGSKELVDGDLYNITATVCDKGKYDGGEYIVVKNAKANGQKVKGKIKVYLSSSYGEYCAVGYNVTFTSNIRLCDTFPYGKLNYNAHKNIKYTCNVNGGLVSRYRFSLFGSINTAIYQTLYDNLDHDTASVSYAMLTGNTDGIEDGSITSFRYGGVAHIFAVSGLHIGIIYGLLRLLCKKLRLNKYITLAVCLLPLFLYVGICGFTPSSVRAFIMCAVALLSRLIYAKYDSLNSLAIATVIILLINPLNLFGVGFQLSVCAVGAIIVLSKNIVRPFKNVPQKLKDTVGISLSAQAGTLPVMLTRFGYISGAGILLNILIVPLLSAFFAVTFVATFLSLILPFAAQYIMPYASLPLGATVSFLANAGFEKAIIGGFGAGLFVPTYIIGILSLSDKFNLKLWQRLVCVICATAFLCTYIPLKSFSPFGGYKIIASAYYGGGEVLIKTKGEKILIITEGLNLSRTDEFLNRYYSANIDALIILGNEECASIYSSTDFNCDAYVYYEYVTADTAVKYEKSFSLGEIDFEFVDGYSLLAKFKGTAVGVCAGSLIPFDYCDYLFGDGLGELQSSVWVSFNERTSNYCIYDCGDYVLKLK